MLKRFIFYCSLPFRGAWLLLVIWFEDTSEWSQEQLLLAKRFFAAVMLVLLIVTLFFTVKAAGSTQEYDSLEKRIDRIENRQDENFREHMEVKQRLVTVERDTFDLDKIKYRLTVVENNTQHMDRLIYGVVGLTMAVVAQWLLALLKFKLDRDDRMQNRHDRNHDQAQARYDRNQDRQDKGYQPGPPQRSDPEEE